MRQCESEIQDFHTMKQQKLNELPVCIPLRLNQILMMQNGRLVADLAPAVVFLNSGLLRLRERIQELQQEKADIRKQHNQLKRMHVNLIKNRKEKQSKLTELEGRLYQVQMLKFGRTIDLERLEKLGFNKTADELREKLLKEDAKRTKEMDLWEVWFQRWKWDTVLTFFVAKNQRGQGRVQCGTHSQHRTPRVPCPESRGKEAHGDHLECQAELGGKSLYDMMVNASSRIRRWSSTEPRPGKMKTWNDYSRLCARRRKRSRP